MRTLILVIALWIPTAAISLPAASSCNAAVSMVSGCAQNDGSQLTISATETENSPDGASPGSPGTPDAPPPCVPDPVRTTSCGISAERVTNDDGVPLTITDVAQFAPAPVTTVGEPGNVGVAGLPMNFVASASVQTRSGTLLGRPVSVRFSPARFVFSYGDGSTATSAGGGQTWTALGQAPFTPTPTSHTYRTRGTFLTHVTAYYTAEVDIGGGWFPVAGELAIEGSAQRIRIYEADTALVARTCAEQPRATGC